MPARRWFGAGVALQAKLYVIGGVEFNSVGDQQVVTTMIVYDPAADTWTTQAPLPHERNGLAASRVVLNGKPRIEVFGGGEIDSRNNLQYIP